ncbi:uncharacterized protein LOC110843763 [Folsomia candida]|uniref:Peritrophin-1 n=1 Tax=Folsomia candida TaxID=158441 RepID=A0A226ERY3_FOLCA|nr:uncharacterized protein LOC110843763 [Folsomia candida]OXA59917.1 Peritrophin-1 [Folsomia candida]
MSFKIVLVLAIIGIARIDAKAGTLGRDGVISDVDYYDCLDKPNGHEIHPWDCTRFIHCDNGRAHDKSCSRCNVDPVTCPEGWLHFDYEEDKCEYADVAGCHVSGNQTRPDPPTEAPEEVPEDETTAGPEEPVADPRCPVNCEYEPVGCECAIFYQCRDGVYSEYNCPAGLHFNAATKACDVPSEAGCNLNPKTCCTCQYAGTAACSPNYVFQDFNRSVEYTGDHHCIREARVCGTGLVWNSGANNADGACDFKENVPACAST